MMQNKRPRLGRGLDAILPAMPVTGNSDSRMAPIEEVHPNRDQPRKRFDDKTLSELAQSIAEHGILEPILVRKRSGGGYSIIAGERRWRAAQRAGHKDVPIFVRELSEQGAFEAALVENLQREDLNPIETARAFQRLIDEHSYTQESVATRVGKDRSTVANALRLLKLPDIVLDYVETGELSEGHGRAILGALDQGAMIKLARGAVTKGWNVRETERQARGKTPEKAPKSAPTQSPNVRDLESRLSRTLATQVKVIDKKGKGELRIPFASYDDLDRVLAKLFA